jgi:hypothetical protein
MHLIGKINGQMKQFKKKILEQVEIINIHHVIIVEMNGIVNGYQIKHEMIKDEVYSYIFIRKSITFFFGFIGKPVHTVQLLLAERMYKLRDVAQNIEFYGPPHPEDPNGKLILF